MVASHHGVGLRPARLWFALLVAVALLAAALFAAPARATSTIYISELQYNPREEPLKNEYLEFRGPAGQTIDQGIYFVAVEGDRGENEGRVQTIFNLGGLAFGSNGYLVLLQQGSPYNPVAGASVVSSTALGWTGLPDGRYSSESTIREPQQIENAAVTFFLISTSTPPTIGNDIDPENDGTANGSVYNGWAVLDSVGITDASGGDTGLGDTAYGRINFLNRRGAGRVPAGSTAVVSDSTMQYVGRTSENTGYGVNDWVGSLNFGGAAPIYLLGNRAVTRPQSLANAPLDHVGGPNFVDVPDVAPLVDRVVPANGTVGVALDANIAVTFSEAVTAGAGAFTLTCGITGPVTLTVSGGPTTFTLNPDATLANSENCLLTVVAAQIADNDGDDPPDAMTADFSARFTTVAVGATPVPSPSPEPSPSPGPGRNNKVYIVDVRT